MTSGTFSTYPIASIYVNRADRQRRELRDIESLAESIHRIGLINPPVISREGELIAGERRWTACKSLGWTAIPVQFVDELDEKSLKRLELEENVKRLDLTWQEECLAVRAYHQLCKEEDSAWNAERTAEALGYSGQSVGRFLAVASEIEAGNEKVLSADKFSVAHNVVQRNNERKRASQLSSVSATAIQLVVDNTGEQETDDTVLREPERPSIPLICADFHSWQETYDGPLFNLIHCDFPYGINVTDAPRQNSAIQDTYADDPDVYRRLLHRLALAMHNVVAESAHLIFWFDMKYYQETYDALTGMGWACANHPLIWHKLDNSGVAPDPQRLPRRTYETAFFCHRGDRKLTSVGARSNSFGFPGNRSDAIHVSEKPLPVLRHFLSMVCDEYSSIFDPTAGSGNSIKVGLQLGATAGLGLELSPEFHAAAIANWWTGGGFRETHND